MNSTQDQLTAAQDAVGHVLANNQCRYVNTMALRQLVGKRETSFLNFMSVHAAPQPLHIPRCLAHVFNDVREPSGNTHEFLALRQALEVAEADAATAEAFTIMEPLVEEVRRLEALLLAETADYHAKMQQVAAAQEKATADALAAVEADPAIGKLRQAAESIRPAHIDPPAPVASIRSAADRRELAKA